MTIIRQITGTSADYAPQYNVESNGGGNLATDPSGNLLVRAQVLTDEGGYRVNFSGNSIYTNIGTITTVNGSNIINGTNFNTYNFIANDYVKLGTDSDAQFAQIQSILSPTQIQLYTSYTGSSSTGPGVTSSLVPSMGLGGSYSVSNGALTINTGNSPSDIIAIYRSLDVLPLVKQSSISISQRTLNQDIYLGFVDGSNISSPHFWAWFHFSGTDATKVSCESAFNTSTAPSIYEQEINLVSIPANNAINSNLLNTSTSLRYRIELTQDKCRFFINDILVATNYTFIPHVNSLLWSSLLVVNKPTPPTNSTSIVMNYDNVIDFDAVETVVPNNMDQPGAATGESETLVDLMNILISKINPIVTGTGTSGILVPRVTVSSDSSLAANQSTNVAQFGATNVSTGVGLGGAGIPRVTLSSDSFIQGTNITIGATLPIIYNNIVCS